MRQGFCGITMRSDVDWLLGATGRLLTELQSIMPRQESEGQGFSPAERGARESRL